jgi:hypothetical protein
LKSNGLEGLLQMLTAEFLPGVPIVESPFFSQDVELLPEAYRDVARQLNENGYAVFDFPDPLFDRKAEAIKSALAAKFDWGDPAKCASQRVQDAWRFDENIRGVAANPAVMAMLAALYGRAPIPFQTLNFPVGTQQSMHSDHLHFNSVPDRFMCGVWVALEDIDEDNGPLFYYPGSHKWPSFQNENLGVSYKEAGLANERFTRLYEALAARSGIRRRTFLAKKGQALIWAANLLHGGSVRKDPARSRWSQVTHYFFEGCAYTTPVANDVYQGKIMFREIVDIRDMRIAPNIVSGHPVGSNELEGLRRMARILERMGTSPFRAHADIPKTFDPLSYLARNRDVLELECDPYEHYVAYGKSEKRLW